MCQAFSSNGNASPGNPGLLPFYQLVTQIHPMYELIADTKLFFIFPELLPILFKSIPILLCKQTVSNLHKWEYRDVFAAYREMRAVQPPPGAR